MMSAPTGNCTFNNGGGLIAPYITWCYKSSTFCDLVLIASGNQRIQCHKLVMCSLSQRLLSVCSDAQDMEDTTFIHLPQFTHQEVKSVVDMIYGLLDQGKVEIPSDEVTTLLGIETSPLRLNDVKNRKAEDGNNSDVAKLENGCSDNWEIKCHPDLVKSEEMLNDDEDRMNYETWTTDDKFKAEERGCDVEEEQAQGCLSLFHEYYQRM